MKKGVSFEWDEECQNALDNIKRYLTNPPVLVAPIKGKVMILYITALDHSLGALLDQENGHGKENACYISVEHSLVQKIITYLSRKCV